MSKRESQRYCRWIVTSVGEAFYPPEGGVEGTFEVRQVILGTQVLPDQLQDPQALLNDLRAKVNKCVGDCNAAASSRL